MTLSMTVCKEAYDPMDHDDRSFDLSVFSDETELFRTPEEPDAGQEIRIRIRMKKREGVQVILKEEKGRETEMLRLRSDALFDWYETYLTCPEEAFGYLFRIRTEERSFFYTKAGIRESGDGSLPEDCRFFRVFPGFHVPEWAKGSLQYQIFPDRFFNGNPDNDVLERECFYAGGYLRHAKSWAEMPGTEDYRCFYGGDLAGVRKKLDYISSLGVETIYLNPVFVSPTPHKYDTQDYRYIDPHLTCIPRDEGRILEEGERDNTKAERYILRTTEPENLEASNRFFAEFCDEVHAREMRIILDGVFNHAGSFHRWLDREGIYRKKGDPDGAYKNPESSKRNYFRFSEEDAYESWYGFETLPKLNYEESEELCEEILQIAEKWVRPPYRIDGWRLDVGADLGHSDEFNHRFWKEFRKRVKKANPDAVILAEHYGDPSGWLEGDEWDTVMNFDAFMEPVSFFLTGLEKHSDYRRDDLYQNGPAFFGIMQENMAKLPLGSLRCAMNELSNHDHSRFLTRTNGRAGRLESAGSEAASEGIQKAILREAVLIQMTWPGAPTIYYGDEAGLAGWTDPDNRRTYPWGREDQELIGYHKTLAAFREKLPVLKNGSICFLSAGYGSVSYARFDKDKTVVIAVNNLDLEQDVLLPLDQAGIPDGAVITRIFLTDEKGYSGQEYPEGIVKEGQISVSLPAQSAAIYLSDQR